MIKNLINLLFSKFELSLSFNITLIELIMMIFSD